MATPLDSEYFYYDGCTDVPIQSTDVRIQSRWSYSDGCSIAEIEGYVMLGGTDGSVYRWDKDEWVEENKVESGAALGVYEGKVIAVGGMTNDGFSKNVMVQEEKDKKWTVMPEMEMPFGCAYSSVVSVVGGGLLVLGWEEYKLVPSVLVFDVDSKTWHIGPQIPSNGVIVRPFRFEETPKRETPFQYVSAVIYGDLVFTLINATVETEVWYAKISDLSTKATYVWRELPKVSHYTLYTSSICVADGVLLAIGRSILAFSGHKWECVEDRLWHMQYPSVATLSDQNLLVVDWGISKVLKVTMKEALAKKFPNISSLLNTCESAETRATFEEAMFSKQYPTASATSL